jgi:hypothetical protein
MATRKAVRKASMRNRYGRYLAKQKRNSKGRFLTRKVKPFKGRKSAKAAKASRKAAKVVKKNNTRKNVKPAGFFTKIFGKK